jgi:hypothetical protein
VLNPLDVKTAKQFVTVVTFQWGVANTYRYARWDSNFLDVLSAPELDVETDKQHGGVQDVSYRVTLRTDRVPLDMLLRTGVAFATLQVEIGECDPTDYAATYRVHFVGRVSQSVRNAKGLPNLVRLEVIGWKERIGYPLGLLCTSTCQHVLGDAGCGVKLNHYDYEGLCNAINKDTISIVGLPDGDTDSWWEFGQASFDGLDLMIVEQLPNKDLRLIKPPPPEWLGHIVLCLPGCNKEYAGDCKNKWGNQKRFLGLGIKMPLHNPQTEPG